MFSNKNQLPEIWVSFRFISVVSVALYIVIATIFEFSDVLPTFFSSVALYICLACCVFNCFLTNRLKVNWLTYAMLIFGMVLTVSVLYTPAKVEAGSRIYRYWTSFFLVMVVYNTLKTNKDIQVLINAFIIGGVGVSLFVYSYYGLDFLLSSDARMQNGDFGNVNVLASNCGLSIVLAGYRLSVIKKSGSIISRLFLILSIVICIPIVMFTGSRRALLSVVISLVVFVFMFNTNKAFLKRLLPIAVIVILAVLIINLVPAFEVIRERLVGLFDIFEPTVDEEDMVSGDAKRLYYIAEGWKCFLSSPIYGHGFCYSYFLFDTYSHNNYIELLMNNGIIGFLSFYWIYVKLTSETIKIKKNNGIFALTIMLIVRLLFEEIGVVDHYSRLVLLLLCIMVAQVEIAKPNKTKI